ncbi:oxidoreductase [Burkholderia pseudomallei]|nr:oxidoreductase [Burkholderia pseudomallei]
MRRAGRGEGGARVRRLHPPLAQPATALCRVPGYGALVQLWRRVRATLPGVVCFEAMRPAFYRCVAAHAPARRRRSTRTAASRR